jgi:signal transduction histidine kinase
MGLVRKSSRGLYVGGVKAGSYPLSESPRLLGRLFLWVLVAQLCSAALAPTAGGQDREAVHRGLRAALHASAGYREFLDRSRFPGEVYEQRPASVLEQTSTHLMELAPGSTGRSPETPRQGGNRWYVIAGVGLILLEAILIAGLVLQRANQRRAEQLLSERLRFESLLSDLSARLVPAAVSDVDAEIERGLQRVVEFLRVDRASLHEYGPGGAVIRISWAGEGAGRPSRITEGDHFPWTTAQLQRGHVVRFSRIDELPAEAAIDRQGYLNVGTQSSLSFPLSAGGSLLGVLSFDSIHGEGTWPDELVQRLRLLGEVFVGALARRRLELSLAARLRFETLLSEQTATFSSLSAADVDREIERALGRIADFFEADWGRLTEFSRDSRMARITHSWAAKGAVPASTLVSLEEIPWVAARLQHGEVVRFSRIDQLPEAAVVDRRTYLGLGITSHVEIPLKIGGLLVGALAFSTLGPERAWPDELVHRLQLLGEVFANILSRRWSEMEAHRLREELAHVGRVSTIGELTVSLAHELNQPLAAILSNAEAAQDALELTPPRLAEVREILTDIVEDDKRASSVIRRLHDLLKKRTPEFTEVDVNEMVSEVARLVQGDAALRVVPVRLDLGSGIPRVRGDRVQLQQVVLNLVLNGLHAVQESATGNPTIILRTVRESPSVVRVAVQDSGVGIDGEDLDRMFEPFYTTKPAGLGMGLAIARSIVEAHGGRLGARSNPEGGATFFFTLPASGEQT